MSREIKTPINLRLGTQRIQIGYEIRRLEGTTIFAVPIPGWGLHVSFHPSGIINVSDHLGFERRIDLNSPEILESAEEMVEYFLEDIIDSMEEDPEFDEDVVAFGNFGGFESRLMRRTPYGLDINPLGAMRTTGPMLPFVFIDQEAVTAFLESRDATPTLLVAPKSERVFFTDSERSISLKFDLKDPMGIVGRLPLGLELVQAFHDTLSYIKTAPENIGMDPSGYLAAQMAKLDAERLTKEIMKALGAPIGSMVTRPFATRFTTDGYEPIGP